MKKGAKRLISLMLTVVMILTVAPVLALGAGVSDFTDVASSHWAYENIDEVVRQGLFKGVSDTEFEPETSMTRGMFVTVLARYAEAEINDNADSPFEDVESGMWYNGSIIWAKDNEIAKGVGEGKFEPDKAMTREQAATFIARYVEAAEIGVTETEEPAEFADAGDISDYAKDAVELCRNSGIINGFPDGKLYPQESSNRAQMAAIMTRFIAAVIIYEDVTLSGESDEAYKNVNLHLTGSAKWTVSDNLSIRKLEVEEGAEISADYPVIVEFTKSSTIKNGQVINNVQFINDYDEVVAFVHTNDVHGNIDIEPYVKGYADSLEESGDYSLVLTVSAGDVFAGGYGAAHIYQGEFIPAIMAETYDIMTIGNNDFGLKGASKQATLLGALGESPGMKVLLSNQVAKDDYDMLAYAGAYVPSMGTELFTEVYDSVTLVDGVLDWSGVDLESHTVAEGEYVLDPKATYETELGTKIGFYGMSTNGGAADTELTGLPSIETSQKMADELRSDDCTVVVGVVHTGWPDNDETLTATSSNDTNSAQIALQTTGIDALIDGHTHSVINGGKGWMGGESVTYVNQASAKGEAIGVMYLYIKDGEVVAASGDNITDTSGITPDKDVQAIVDKTYAKLDEDGYLTIIANSEHFLNGTRTGEGNVGGGVRMNETNLGDLVADSIRVMSKEITGKDIDIALYPGFWVRSSIAAGEITKFDVMGVFANVLQVFYTEYTAEELVAAMNKANSSVGLAESIAFNQVSGLTVEYYYYEGSKGTSAAVYSLKVGDTLIYENGVYKVDSSWKCSAALTLTAADTEDPIADGWDINDQIIASKEDMADIFCEYMLKYKPEILPNTIAPGGRIIEHVPTP